VCPSDARGSASEAARLASLADRHVDEPGLADGNRLLAGLLNDGDPSREPLDLATVEPGLIYGLTLWHSPPAREGALLAGDGVVRHDQQGLVSRNDRTPTNENEGPVPVKSPQSTQPSGEPTTLAPWLRWVGHCGYVSEGVVYVLIGGFALVAALEPSQQPNGPKGALAKLAAAPFGDAMLVLLALGLAAFVLWQVVLGVIDPEHRRDRRTIKRRAVRLGCLLNGALHGVLVGEAAWRLLGLGGAPDEGRSQAAWTGRAMALPFGRWMIATTGVGLVLFGVFQWYRAASRNKTDRVDLTQTRLRGVIIALGIFGFLARGVLFGVIGAFLIDAARRYDTANATGIAGALNALKRQEYGHWLLGVVAVGLISYGSFQIIKEPYRDFHAS